MNRTMRRKDASRQAASRSTMEIPSGETIQKMRKERWLSVLDLAKKSKVTRQAIAAWESGKRVPRFGTAKKVWEALLKVQPVQGAPDQLPKE